MTFNDLILATVLQYYNLQHLLNTTCIGLDVLTDDGNVVTSANDVAEVV